MTEALLLYKNQKDTIQKTVSILKADTLVVLPCDTIYGLSGKVGPFTCSALKELKKSVQQQQFAILATLEQAQDLCFVPDILLEHWPCALTVVLSNRHDQGSTAIRVPKDPFMQQILTELGAPIYSTAVNPSGFTITNITDIIFTYKNKVQAIVIDPDRQRDTPSTMIDMRTQPCTLLRCGSYDASAILSQY